MRVTCNHQSPRAEGTGCHRAGRAEPSATETLRRACDDLARANAALGAEKDELRRSHAESETHLRERTAELERTNASLQAEIAGRREADEAFRQSEARFQAAFDQASVGLAMANLDGLLFHVNRAFCDFTGFTREELLGKTCLDLTHPDDRAASIQLIADLTAGIKPSQDLEKRYLTRGGEIIWGQSSVSLLHDSQGRPTGFIALVQNITARKQAEQAHNQLATVIEVTPQMVAMAAPDGRLTYLNRAGRKLLGIETDAELAQLTICDVHPESEHRFILDEVLPATLRDGAWSGETKILSRDGREVPVWLAGNATRGPDGSVEFFSAVIHDITQRRQAEQALRESERRLREMAEAIDEVVWMVDARTRRMIYVNPAYEKIWGRPCCDLDTTLDAFLEAVHPDDQPRLLTAMQEQAQGGVLDVEYRVVRPDGSMRWVWDRGFPIRGETGEVERIVGVAQDITERKRAEDQVASLNAQLERRLDRINALRRIDAAITASLDLRLNLGIVLDQVTEQLQVDAATVLLVSPNQQTLEYAASKGFHTRPVGHPGPRLSECLAGRAVLERHGLRVDDLTHPPQEFTRSEMAANEGFVAYRAVPLVAKGQVRGVLEIFQRRPIVADSEWQDFLEALAGQAAIAVENASLFESLQRTNADLVRAYDATIEGWSHALDLRDRETEGHTQRVAHMTTRLAQLMGVGPDEMIHMRRGALLHDIGKMGIPDAILLKPGPLNDEEWTIMRKHPVYAFEMLSAVTFLHPALDIPYCHHEKWDGTGYPRGLKGEQIPLAARIFAAVDIWDALRFDRPYRKAWPEDAVREHIRGLAGTHLDPRVVEVFLSILEEPEPDEAEPDAPRRRGRALGRRGRRPAPARPRVRRPPGLKPALVS